MYCLLPSITTRLQLSIILGVGDCTLTIEVCVEYSCKYGIFPKDCKKCWGAKGNTIKYIQTRGPLFLAVVVCLAKQWIAEICRCSLAHEPIKL